VIYDCRLTIVDCRLKEFSTDDVFLQSTIENHQPKVQQSQINNQGGLK